MADLETAVFAGGCFWCTEAIFKRIRGVSLVTPGYSGGNNGPPTYESVSTGKTGHAEAVQVMFDPSIVSYKTLLEIFWKLHDPTTPDQQGADFGPQYRSIVFYADENQKQIAQSTKEEAQSLYKNKIVTEIIPFQKFYPADANHKDYYDKNIDAPYCKIVIDPKIQKLYKDFGDITKQIKKV